MNEWQSMETTPNSDTEVLVFDPKYGVCLAEFNLGDWIATCAGCFVNIGVEEIDLIHLSPTHWRTKPDAPTQPS